MALKLKKKGTKEVKKVVKKAPTAQQRTSKAAVKRSGAELTYASGKYTEGIGRRKVATARVRLYESQGDFIVNDMLVSEYFATVRSAETEYTKPFELTGTHGKFSVSAKVSGSGTSAQLGALMHGISRALVKYDPSFRVMLKPSGLLTRDDRMKETRKIGHGGKARRKRQSPKR